MKITSKTHLYGLIGYPAKHSLSPLMHNYFFKVNNIDSVYLSFEIPPQGFDKVMKAVNFLGIKGLNVTIPYKERVIKYLDYIDKRAEIIGAVNTVKIKEGKLLGFNTDGDGFLESLRKKANFNPYNKRVVILGAGGAAKAVASSLAQEEISFLGIFDVLLNKAEILKRKLKRYFKGLKIFVYRSVKDIDLKNIDILINATGVGMKKKDPLVIPKKKLLPHLLVYDLIYNPPKPKLLKEAEKKGARVINGIWMLIYQGLRSLEIWLDREFKGKESILLKGLKRNGL